MVNFIFTSLPMMHRCILHREFEIFMSDSRQSGYSIQLFILEFQLTTYIHQYATVQNGDFLDKNDDW